MTQRDAIVLPGGRYGPHAPLLMYAADAAAARGARVLHVEWDPATDPALLTPEDRGPWVVAAELGLPAGWLTPVLTSDWVVDALRRASAPALLVGGTADSLWDGRLARELSAHVLEIDGADHGMYVPGRLAASAAVLGRVATAVEDFLDEVVFTC